jgi:ribonuclease D
MLKDNSELVDRFVESIRHAKICAIDTESIVGKTKLDKKKEESPSIIQVALEKEVFIIDCFEKNERVK